MRIIVLAAAAAALSGCVTTETVQFRPSNPQQQAMVRDGRPALVSRGKHSLVMVRPAERKLAPGGRPVFVVGIYNMSSQPMDFRVSQVDVSQNVNGQHYPMQVVTYETLVQEERNKQVAMAIIAGVAAGANAYAASRAGHGSFDAVSHGRYGTVTTSGSFYSPMAAAIAQSNAAVQNEAMLSAVVDRGQQNMAALEQTVIKDNTIFPGEWYGGAMHVSPPTNPPSGSEKNYSLALTIGADQHVIQVSQAPSR